MHLPNDVCLSLYQTTRRDSGSRGWSYTITRPNELPVYSKEQYPSKDKAEKAAKLEIKQWGKVLLTGDHDVWADFLGGIL